MSAFHSRPYNALAAWDTLLGRYNSPFNPAPPPYANALSPLALVPPPVGLLGAAAQDLFGGTVLTAPPPLRWAHVSQRFATFHANLRVTDAQAEAANTKRRRITSLLNRYYWGHDFEELNCVVIGSW